jgi:hypothetical protein
VQRSDRHTRRLQCWVMGQVSHLPAVVPYYTHDGCASEAQCANCGMCEVVGVDHVSSSMWCVKVNLYSAVTCQVTPVTRVGHRGTERWTVTPCYGSHRQPLHHAAGCRVVSSSGMRDNIFKASVAVKSGKEAAWPRPEVNPAARLSQSGVCGVSCSTPRRCGGSTPLLFLVRVLGTSWYWARGVFYW